MSGMTFESDIASSSSACNFFIMSGRRLSSQKRYVVDVEVVSVPAILEKRMLSWVFRSRNLTHKWPIHSEMISWSGMDRAGEYWYCKSRSSIAPLSASPDLPAFIWARISYTRPLTNWYSSTSKISHGNKISVSPRLKFCQNRTFASTDCYVSRKWSSTPGGPERYCAKNKGVKLAKRKWQSVFTKRRLQECHV